MDSVDGEIGVWKSAPGKGRKTPKGRQVDDQALADVQALLGETIVQPSTLIFLSIILFVGMLSTGFSLFRSREDASLKTGAK